MWEGGGGGRRRREGGSTNAEGILREGGSMTFNLVTVRVPEEVRGGEGGGLGTPRKYGSDGKVVVVARVAKEELKDQLQAMRVRLHGPAGA